MTTDSVTVITLTRARPELALRAITSVRGQDYDDDVTHVVIIDECEESADVLGALESSPGRGLSIVQRKRLASRSLKAPSPLLARPSDPITDMVRRPSVFQRTRSRENYLQAAIDRNDRPDDCLLEALLSAGCRSSAVTEPVLATLEDLEPAKLKPDSRAPITSQARPDQNQILLSKGVCALGLPPSR
jgi:hypothetical protein